METYRCEAAPEATRPGELEVTVDASSEETAAIIAAIAADIEIEQEKSRGDGEPPACIDPWTLAGRLSDVAGGTRRPRTEAPTDPWTTAGRADRF